MFDDDEDVELSEDTVKDLSVPEENAGEVQGGMPIGGLNDACPTGGQTTATEACKETTAG